MSQKNRILPRVLLYDWLLCRPSGWSREVKGVNHPKTLFFFSFLTWITPARLVRDHWVNGKLQQVDRHTLGRRFLVRKCSVYLREEFKHVHDLMSLTALSVSMKQKRSQTKDKHTLLRPGWWKRSQKITFRQITTTTTIISVVMVILESTSNQSCRRASQRNRKFKVSFLWQKLTK